jgi:hypothetical protein
MGLFVTPVPLAACVKLLALFIPLFAAKFAQVLVQPCRSGQRLVGPDVCRPGRRRASGRLKGTAPAERGHRLKDEGRKVSRLCAYCVQAGFSSLKFG